jgi:hypothetical protein
MSHDVSKSFVQQFESEVKHEYQESGKKLRDTVRFKGGVTGKSVSWPVYGKGVAMDRGASASDVETMGTATKNVEAILQDKIAAEYSDYFDEAKLNFNDRQELAEVIGCALGRCEDQMIIDACATSATTNVVAANIDDGTTDGPLTLKKVKRAKRLLDNAGVTNKDRFFVYTPGGLDSLLEDQKVGSVDYNNVKALVDGDIDTFLGFKFVMIADQVINDGKGNPVKTGLPGVGTATRKYFAYHKKAVGFGVGIDFVTSAGWVEHKDAYLVKGKLSAAAKALDPTGVVEINVKEEL